MDYFEIMMGSKGYQQRKIMRHDISCFCISGKVITVTTYSCVSGHFLRITEPTHTIGKSATCGMMMDLICADQLAKSDTMPWSLKKENVLGI
jgi:hypothetical protein